jgi:hypothetical protein
MWPVNQVFERGWSHSEGMLSGGGCMKVAEAETFKGGVKRVSALIGRKPPCDEGVRRRKLQAEFTNAGAKLLPWNIFFIWQGVVRTQHENRRP